MAEKLLRRGQTIYAADGTYLGRMLQCDARFMVIGNSRWKPDHWIIPNEEVAAASGNAVILRSLPDAIRPEISELWWPPCDPIGNANGVDLEPLRAGMAEMEDKRVGTAETRPAGASVAGRGSRADPPLPTPEDAYGLERERVARIDAQVDRYIAAEIEDFQIAAACATPSGFEHVARYDVAFALDATSWTHGNVETMPRALSSVSARRGEARSAPALSLVGNGASRNPRALERVLRKAGFSRLEAKAIVSGGFQALAAFREKAPAAPASHQVAAAQEQQDVEASTSE
jgi:hypothetical protein